MTDTKSLGDRIGRSTVIARWQGSAAGLAAAWGASGFADERWAFATFAVVVFVAVIAWCFRSATREVRLEMEANDLERRLREPRS